jgi:hypothetical protein
MPLPKPKTGETQSAFVSRCIAAEKDASPGRSDDQIAAMCYQAWRDRRSEGLKMCPGLNPPTLSEDMTEVRQLREEITLDGVEFIEQDGVRTIKNFKMLGPRSKHGYTYTAEAMKKAISCGLYEGCRMFVNHSPNNHARSVMDMAGVFKNTRFVDGAIRGDAVLLNDQWGQKVWEIAKTMPHAAGFSHVANGAMKRHNGQSFVEEIREVLSVDLVVTPATTTNMFESTDERKPKMELNALTIGELKTGRPDLAEALVQEGAKSRDEEIAKLMEDNGDLKKKVDEFQVKESAAKHASDVDKLLSESKLPDTARTDIFRESLLALSGDDWKEKAGKMIEDRRKLVSGVKDMGGGKDTNLNEGTADETKVTASAFREALGS